ncbi:MAG: hypothetical protein ACPW61_00800 [Methyloligella sp. ZOD6]
MHKIIITTSSRNATCPDLKGIWDVFLQEGKLTGPRRSKNPGGKPSSRKKEGVSARGDKRLRLERADAADYLAGMLKGSMDVARGAEMRFLAYLIEVAMQEAQDEKTRSDSR